MKSVIEIFAISLINFFVNCSKAALIAVAEADASVEFSFLPFVLTDVCIGPEESIPYGVLKVYFALAFNREKVNRGI